MTETTTALYIRLSQDDGNDGESNSVKNQRDLLTDFVRNHPELSKNKVLTFIDDGWSGTNFERPKVKEMLEQVKAGKIQSIAVKDFSRFGRNYIEVGTYLEQIFPFLGVRFLSVNDHFDSNDKATSAGGLELAFKTLIHDLYSRDLSVKSKTGKLAKTAKGEHVCGWAPYGYNRSKAVKNAWEIDEVAAAIIRRVFDMALEGLMPSGIASRLNADGVPTPLTRRRETGTNKGIRGRWVDETPFWTAANVSKILRDERYTGKLITGRMKRAAVGSRKCVPVPERDWITVPDAHPVIITEETFYKAQSLLPPYGQRKIKKVNVNLFSGKVICGHCGHALRYYGGPRMKNPNFVCMSHRLIQREPCFAGKLYEAQLKEAVLEVVKHEATIACEAQKGIGEVKKQLATHRESLAERVKYFSSEVVRLKNYKAKLFEDYSDGGISKEFYVAKKAEQSHLIENAEAELKSLSDELEKQSDTVSNEKKYERVSPFASATEVTPEMMALVEKILIYSEERIEIKFTFADSRKL